MNNGQDSYTDLIAALKNDTRNLYIGSDFRADEHLLAAARWGLVHRGLSSIAAVFSAVAGASLLADSTEALPVAGVLALIAAGCSALDATLKAGQLADEHKLGFDGFTAMRTKWLEFRDVTMSLGASPQELAAKFAELLRQRDEVSKNVPAPPEWAKREVAKRRREEAKRKSEESKRRSESDSELSAPTT